MKSSCSCSANDAQLHGDTPTAVIWQTTHSVWCGCECTSTSVQHKLLWHKAVLHLPSTEMLYCKLQKPFASNKRSCLEYSRCRASDERIMHKLHVVPMLCVPWACHQCLQFVSSIVPFLAVDELANSHDCRHSCDKLYQLYMSTHICYQLCKTPCAADCHM